MLLHSPRLKVRTGTSLSKTEKPQKKLYIKPEATKISLEDDEALLKLFKQDRKKVKVLRTIVNELLKNSQ